MCVQDILSVEKDLIEAILPYCILNVLSTFAIKRNFLGDVIKLLDYHC